MTAKLVLENINKQYGEGDTTVMALKMYPCKSMKGNLSPSSARPARERAPSVDRGALLTPTSGRILISGFNIANISARRLNRVRLEHIGFVFQSSNLVPYLTVLDQLMLIGKLDDGEKGKRNKRRCSF